MTVDPDYLEYPGRKRGQDHDLYEASFLPDRKPVEWPGGARVALWIVPVLEFFPMNMDPKPISPPGGMARIYPDYWSYTLADYGTRVGIYRVIKALRDRGMTASVAISGRLAELYPAVAEDCLKAGFELMAHGRDMGHLHGDHLSESEEGDLVEGARDAIGKIAGKAPQGWLSPAMALSRNTTRLVAEAGFGYTADWISDELPFPMTGPAAGLCAMPLAYELSDLRLIGEYRRMAWDYTEQLLDAFAFLSTEAGRQGGRMLALPVHPRLIGAPHRIGAFEAALDGMAETGAVWCATGSDILAHWKGQQ
jgi:peptidoglycan/xylan/chitin deacetylase (PgdA/CDA1 family)